MSITRRVARIWKRGGGAFLKEWKKRKRLFHCSWIFIILESVGHGLSENWEEISGEAQKFKGFFRPKSGGLQKKKKRSTPKFRLLFRPVTKILTFAGGLFFYGEAVFKFSPKTCLRSNKNVRFCILHKPMGRARAPPPPPWLRYCL